MPVDFAASTSSLMCPSCCRCVFVVSAFSTPGGFPLPFFSPAVLRLCKVQKIAWHAFRGLQSFSPPSFFPSHTHTHTILISINPLTTLISTFVIRNCPRALYRYSLSFTILLFLPPRGDTYSFIPSPLVSHRTGNGD